MVDAITVLDVATPCVRCGYDLRGLSSDRACPECGLGIARSLLLGQRLRDSRPVWLACLAWAARFLFLVQLLFFVALFVADYPELLTGILCTAALIHCIASWMLTRRENPHATVQPSRRLNVVLRLCSLGPVVAALLLAHKVIQDDGRFPWLAAIFACPFIPCPLLQFVLLRRLARRVLDNGLAEHSAIVAFGYTGSLVLLPLVPFVGSTLPRADAMHLDFLLIFFTLVSVMLFWAWSMLLLRVYISAFALAARNAKAAWRQADATLPQA